MHRASTISNIGWGTITIIVSIRGGESNRKKDQSRLLNSIPISLLPSLLPRHCEVTLFLLQFGNRGRDQVSANRGTGEIYSQLNKT